MLAPSIYVNYKTNERLRFNPNINKWTSTKPKNNWKVDFLSAKPDLTDFTKL